MNTKHLKYLAYDQLDGGRLRQHQAEGVAMMVATPKTLNADPVGAGKTVQAAGVIAHLVESGRVTPDRSALVLTLGSQLARQTATELIRFLPGVTVQGLAGSPGLAAASVKRRREAISQPAHVKVMTYTQWRTRGDLWEGPPPALFLDEVSALKGGGQEHAAVMRLASEVPRVHMFSATPYENDPTEMWRIYALLHLSHLPGQEEFGRQYVEWRAVDRGQPRPVGWSTPRAAEEFRRLTAAHYLRREWAVEDLDLPKYQKWDWWVPLSPAQQGPMEAANRLTGLQRHQQQKAVVTGAIGGPSARGVEAARLVGQLVERDRDAKILVIVESMTELETVAAGLTDRRIGWAEVRGKTKQSDRGGVVEEFRDDPHCRVLIGSKVLERGLNLQFCRYLVTVGLPDNPGRMEQQVGRIVRHGSPFPEVTHYVVLADCEFDRATARRVLRKERNAALVMEPVG